MMSRPNGAIKTAGVRGRVGIDEIEKSVRSRELDLDYMPVRRSKRLGGLNCVGCKRRAGERQLKSPASCNGDCKWRGCDCQRESVGGAGRRQAIVRGNHVYKIGARLAGCFGAFWWDTTCATARPEIPRHCLSIRSGRIHMSPKRFSREAAAPYLLPLSLHRSGMKPGQDYTNSMAMSKTTPRPEIAGTPIAAQLWAWSLRSPVVGKALVILAGTGMVILFYAIENNLGRRAWKQCKQALAAQGAVLDEGAQATNVIPDHLNILKAPGMSEWFLGPSPNQLISRLNAARRNAQDSADLIQITVVARKNQAALAESNLCLDYDPPLLGLADTLEPGPAANPSQVIPLIVMDKVPLSLAIKNLAQQDGRKYLLDSNIISSWKQAGLPEPTVTIRWEDVTAFQALIALLENYNLAWLENPTNHVGRISIKSEFSEPIQWTPAAREQLQKIVVQVSSLTAPDVHTLKASQGFVLYCQDDPAAGSPIQPAQITLRSANVPTPKEVKAFFPGALPRWRGPAWLRVSPSGTNSFRVFADPPLFCSAKDYLAQTDPFKPAFDLMREALKRPYARVDADYGRTLITPPRNYVTARIVSQALAARAQAYLLLGQPEQALAELTLLHDLSAVLEAQPVNLVSAMIEVAITGLYVEVIHDGLRLGAWREPQLIVLQAQLAKIHLARLFVNGLANERWVICRTIESASPRDFADAFDPSGARQSLWEKLKSPGFCVLTFGPRGWRYQSMAATAMVLQRNIDCFDRVTQTLRPAAVEQADPNAEPALQRRSPRTSLAWIATPNIFRAWKNMAHNQTSVDHAFIACALERFRLARSEYPSDLPSLNPGFADRLPHAIIEGDCFHYQRIDACHFTLYSLGWNRRDKAALDSSNNSPADCRDWVWN